MAPPFSRKAITYSTRAIVAISSLLCGVFTILWALGPFYVTGGRVHIPGATETISIQMNAGMVHMTFNHDIPPGSKWFFHGFTPYPAFKRNLHLHQYRSLQLPVSEDYKSSFGSTIFVLEMYDRQYRYSRYWFPIVVPAFVFSIIPSIAFLCWRVRKNHSLKTQATGTMQRTMP